MPKVFISYRREDADLFAGRLCDRLQAEYGRENVFMDVDSIPFGVDFRQNIADAVGGCDFCLAVIGGRWLDSDADGRRRIDDPRDYVRLEIATALGAGIPVIPVLVGETVAPKETELPDDLKPLAYRNACPVAPGRDFHLHVERLIKGLGTRPHNVERPERQEVSGSSESWATGSATTPNVRCPWIEIASGPDQGTRYKLSLDRITIGRHPDCDISLSSAAISRYHTQLVRTEAGYEIEDLHTRNGTYVNGRTISDRVLLADGDRIHVGEYILKYRRRP
jgi:hypothetical protein